MSQEKSLTWLQSKGRLFLKNNQVQIIIVLVGLALIGAGVLSSKSNLFKDNQVEIITPSPNANQNTKEIVVEISGEVEKPGVYKLPNGSRVEDLLVVSGGLSIKANRETIEKGLNRAAKLVDGQKIYIPSVDEQTNVLSANVSTSQLGVNQNFTNISEGISQTGQKLVNINSSSQVDLEKLSGIGPVYAQNIIEGRPYSEISELVSKKIIPQKTFDKIKEQISVY